MILKHWWKALGALLTLYSIIGGFLFPVPELNILNETIRNLYFHVPMWFAMMTLMTISVVYSIKHLRNSERRFDVIASEAAITGIIFGLLGLATGSLWARFTWMHWWIPDPKLNGAAITILAYFAYVLLRTSIADDQKRGRVAAVYNIFAFMMMIVFLMIVPRLDKVQSNHPGNGGNPAFSIYDNASMDLSMRYVFYPAVLGWILISLWFMQQRIRLQNIIHKKYYS